MDDGQPLDPATVEETIDRSSSSTAAAAAAIGAGHTVLIIGGGPCTCCFTGGSGSADKVMEHTTSTPLDEATNPAPQQQ